jgi:hypothetical protein
MLRDQSNAMIAINNYNGNIHSQIREIESLHAEMKHPADLPRQKSLVPPIAKRRLTIVHQTP